MYFTYEDNNKSKLNETRRFGSRVPSSVIYELNNTGYKHDRSQSFVAEQSVGRLEADVKVSTINI